jgi:O-antigen ligase
VTAGDDGDPPGAGLLADASEWLTWSSLLAALAAGLTVAAAFRRGAFYPGDALAVAVASLVLIGARLAAGADRRAVLAAVSVGALAGWWMATALIHHRPGAFLPVGAGMLGFLATFLTFRGLDHRYRQSAAFGLALLGAVGAAVGLVAVAFRIYPQAIPDQGLWRAATTLTYSNAAGCMFAISILVAFGLDLTTRLPRAMVCLLAAALVASESRGAVLAFLVVLPIVPLVNLKAAVRPVLLGTVAGLLEVATSRGMVPQPLVLAFVVVLVAVAAAVPPRSVPLRLDAWRVAAVVVVVIAAAAVAGITLHTQIALRLQPSSSLVRTREWTAAVDQWRAAPVTGVGPDVLLHLQGPGDPVDHFAHDEYLQVLAGAGLVGILFLAASGLSVVLAIRRVDVATSCAAAAVAGFAVASGLDFDWHLPALALMAGWAAGLGGEVRRAESTPVEGRRSRSDAD